jgi:Family of unknown function (DUF6074)
VNKGQLDLFNVAPAEPGADIIVFPLWRREKTIRSTARTLHSRKTEEGKKSFWTRTIRALKAELAERGCDRAEIDRQVAAFRACISDELERLQDEGRRPSGGAA